MYDKLARLIIGFSITLSIFAVFLIVVAAVRIDMSIKEQHVTDLAEAYENGARMNRAGLPIDANPYNRGSLRIQFIEGYLSEVEEK